ESARHVIPYQPVAGIQMSFHQLFLRLRVNKKAGTHKRGYRQVKGYSAGGPAVGVSELWFCCSLNVFLYVSVHVTDKGYY
ncbi:hypothetical protein, partial [Escherichia coli]|uniref:hypothetical protein n=6 Tax=Escherichia coli TaxID=562 RepID=UPI000ADADDD2